MMTLKCLFFVFLVLGTVAAAANNLILQSKECMFTKSKPNSCLYFVMSESMNHPDAAEYCFNVFNGMLTPIHESYDEAIEVMKRYYWWAKSNPNVARLRFAMTERVLGSYQFDLTYINPIDYLGKDLDMEIWNRSFPEEYRFEKVLLSEEKRDKDFDRDDINFPGDGHATWEYMAIKPSNHKWSNANYNRKIPFICEVPRFPKAYCEPGWWLHMKSRSCFYINNIDLKFFDAVNACHAMGSNLASINDETENNMVLRMIKEIITDNSQVWFGLRWNAAKSKDPNIPVKSVENFTIFYDYFVKNMAYNIDGTPVTNFHHFDVEDGQPDGWRVQTGQVGSEAKVENCLLYEVYGRKWHDYNCDVQKAHSVCRKMSSSQPYQ